MARIRSIKPEFWTDETLGECSPTARLLFIATWTFADDKGNLDRSAKQLKAQALPYDALDAEPLVQELLMAGLLVEYESEDRKYLHIKGFCKHQKVEKESLPRFPLYGDSPTTTGLIPEPSTSPRPSSSGVESSRKESSRKGRALALHASLPAAEWAEWLEHRREKRWPVDSRTLGKQLALLVKFDGETQRDMLNTSMQAGWQGLFAPKFRANGAAKPTMKLRTADEIEAEERAHGLHPAA